MIYLWWFCLDSVVKERSSDLYFILWWDLCETSRTLHIWHWVELHLSWWLCSLNWIFFFFFWCTLINMKVASGSNAQERREQLWGVGGWAFFLCTGLVNVTMLSEFGPEHLNTPSITPEILAGHTWLLLQLSCGLNLYVVSLQTWEK